MTDKTPSDPTHEGGARVVLAMTAALLIGAAGAAGAADAAELPEEEATGVLDEARAAYDRGVTARSTDTAVARGAFGEAIERWTWMIEQGYDNASIHYNVGNAWMQQDRVGEAILHYRLALAHQPGHRRAAENLAWARSRRGQTFVAQGTTALTETVRSGLRRLSTSIRVDLALIFWLTMFGVIAARHVIGAARIPRWLILSLAAGFVITSLMALSGMTLERRFPAGVVQGDSITLRKGDGASFEAAYEEPLRAGAEFTLRENRGNWYEIELIDGSHGWIPADQAGLVIVPLR